ncbi:MAG: hypothetical protein M3P22_01605 [bacterium]|nr:hypothetical protein [bacterium]
MYTAQAITSDQISHPNYLNLEYFFYKVYLFFTQPETFDVNFHTLGSVANTFLVLIILFFVAVIAYATVRLFEIRKKEHDHVHHEIHEHLHKRHLANEKKEKQKNISANPRWVTVIEYLASVNEGDWKLAVLEADTMLDDLLDQIGFKGENLGEKLKSADQASFKNLTIAWEVHTIRNRIAHEGANFPLSIREAKRVVALYEDIFRPYGFI